MSWGRMPGWRTLLIAAAIVVMGGAVLGGAFILSGIYDVAASRKHFAITNALISLTLRRSVQTHAMGGEPPDLSSESLAALGARHFALGCAPCHGSPAEEQNPIAEEMLPKPPPLSQAAQDWDTEELHWIVKHGLKYTGMPAWPALRRDEEVWALVAFLERLPGMKAEEYAALAGIEGEGAPSFNFGPQADGEELLSVCENCHGGIESGPVHPLVPRLAGQKQPYLERALTEYARNRRQSGIMEPIAAELGPEAIAELSRAFAEADAARQPPPAAQDEEAIRRGAVIALRGLPSSDIPACGACHAAGTSSQFPRLNGLPAEYISNQLHLFREGVRDGSVYAAIMTSIAQRLSDEHIEAVAAYFASSPAPGAVTASEAAQ